MTTFISSNINTSGLAGFTVGAGSFVYVREGVYVASSNSTGSGIFASAGSAGITVAGIAEGAYGVRLAGNGSGTITIQETGTVLGRLIGFFAESTSSSSVYFSNAGLVQGGFEGVNISIEGAFFGSNSGTIRGVTNDGVRIQSQNDGAFINYGLIETLSRSHNAVDIYHDGSPGTPVEFTNYGTISSFSDYALEMDSNDMNRAHNFGTFNGGAFFGSNDDLFENRGTVHGNVVFDAGNDRYDGIGGLTNGTVSGGEGNDRLIGGGLDDRLEGDAGDDVLGGRNGMDTLWGGAGHDTIFGGADADQINGGGDNDRLIGNMGDDNIDGGSGLDHIDGRSGDDDLHGQLGADWVLGGSGDDLVAGEQGNDTLYAGSGEDTVVGGFGRDLMFGGIGVDTFVWNSTGDSNSFATRDRVFQFTAGEDFLDFSGIIGPDLVFRGSSAFTGNRPELRVFENAFGNSIIQVDTNGNGFGNMNVVVGTVGLSESDFIL